MSREMVEIVRALQPPGDLAALFRSDEATAAAIEAATPFFEPEFETLLIRSDVERASYSGFDGLRRAWIDWLEPWESYRSELEDLIDLGDRVAVLVRDYARRPGMQREIGMHGLSVWVFRGGRISRIEFHFDRKEGLAAIGLTGRATDAPKPRPASGSSV
jgi:ketosteroid isomerase-like protein